MRLSNAVSRRSSLLYESIAVRVRVGQRDVSASARHTSDGGAAASKNDLLSRPGFAATTFMSREAARRPRRLPLLHCAHLHQLAASHERAVGGALRGPEAQGIRSTHCAREGPGSNGSPKYWVSRATSPSTNSMMLTV